MDAIRVRNLVKIYRRPKRRFLLFPLSYEEIRALQGVSFRVKPGTVLGYLGPNGSGKSTTLKILSGVLHPTSGEALVMGYVPWERKREFLERIGVLFGHRTSLIWDVPVEDTFLLFKDIYSIDDETYRRQLRLADEYLNVRRFLNVPVKRLSLGERIRCELAGILLHDPDVLLLDEPTIGVDVWTKQRIRALLRILAEEGKTVVLTTHQMEDVEATADRVILLSKGRIAFDGPLKELYKLVPYKTLFIEYRKEYRPLGYPVVHRGPGAVKYRVPRKDVLEAVKEAVRSYEIVDLRVEEPRLEEVLLEVTL